MRFIVESNPRWERFAAREPYFAVVTAPENLQANFDHGAWRRFFRSGEDLVTAILDTIERHVRRFDPKSALEYGCGVGRIAIPLAGRIERVTGVDISPAMLAVARENAVKMATPHLALETARDFFAKPRKFDLVTCYLVLQRMPQQQGLALLRTLLGTIAPGGVGVFHFPYRSGASAAVNATRWLRERIPPVNAAMNVLRRKPAGEPFIATHVYDLDEVLGVLQQAGFSAAHVSSEQHEGLGAVMLYVRAPDDLVVSEPEAPQPVADELIDPRQIIATTSIDELNGTAEEYFRKLTTWDHHMAKPFDRGDEAASLLINFATVLQSLRLTPGMTVLEYGAGTGWLSRFLTQLGAQAILLDVSATALEIAKELFRRMPVIGIRPEPRFLVFDGRRIALPDESVDRIVSFDAFHHAPNPDDVIAEFGRVLKPGGVAVFAEPGPHHSRSVQSQFEMRVYRVLENDVDIHAIRRAAKENGFTKLEMTLFHIGPLRVSLEQYEDLIAGGPTLELWTDATRHFLGNVRNFALTKAGEERIDSRTPAALAATIVATLAAPARAGEPLLFDATVTNRGTATWLPSGTTFGGVALGAHLYDASGALLRFDLHWQSITDQPREIEPGETIDVRVTLPPLERGRYRIEFDCVSADVTWFAQIDPRRPASVVVDVV